MADQTRHQDASGTADLSGAGEFRIFLSYRREDASGHAGRLFDFLRHGGGERPGFNKDQIFMDIDAMAPGVDFRRVIEQAVGSCDVFIAVVGRQWLNAVDAKGQRRLDSAQDFVRLEIEAALERDIPVVPALVQGAEMPGVEELPETFHAFVHRNAVELSDARWSYDAGRLVAWLKAVEEEKTRRAQAEREHAERAERERADQERLERERAERVAAERAEHEREERVRLEGEQAEQAEQERAEQEAAEKDPAEHELHGARPYHLESTPPEGPERRRIRRKHALFVAALLALAIAGIVSALVLFSESAEREATGEVTTTQPTEDGVEPGDADGDGLSDAEDPFALDPGDGKELPVTLTFDDPMAGTIKDSGFTGLMTDGTTPYDELFDPDNVIVGDGRFTVRAVDPGRTLEDENRQRNAFQFGIRVPDEPFTAHVSLIEPFADGGPEEGQAMGLFVGTGDQDDYVRLAIGGGDGVKFLGEYGGVSKYSKAGALELPGPDFVDLYLTIDPAAMTIQAQVSKTEDGETSFVPTSSFRRRSIPARWINGDEALAVGIISTRGDSARFAAIWGIVEVFAGDPQEITGDGLGTTTDAPTTTDTDTDTDTDTVSVPDVLGQSESSARQELQQAGFEVSAVEAPDDETPVGLVVDQSPDPGTKAEPGSTVQITISTGP